MTDQRDAAASKDRLFEEVAELAQKMIAAHGREFTMGTLVLAARFIAEGKDFRTARETMKAS